MVEKRQDRKCQYALPSDSSCRHVGSKTYMFFVDVSEQRKLLGPNLSQVRQSGLTTLSAKFAEKAVKPTLEIEGGHVVSSHGIQVTLETPNDSFISGKINIELIEN